jgi:putative phosphoribosyl transferase
MRCLRPGLQAAGMDASTQTEAGLSDSQTSFEDRNAAGQLLAAALAHLASRHPVVLALPRGGVPVAAEVARSLHAPLGLVLVRKIGAPAQPELAVGAVAALPASTPGAALGAVELVVDEETLRAVGAKRDHVARLRPQAQEELLRRCERYLATHAQPPVSGRCVIVVDDGLATGTTAGAALAAIRRAGPVYLVLAVPVAPPEAVVALRSLVDELVCLRQPVRFHAVGAHYRQFAQVDDDEVIRALEMAPSESD